VPEKDTRKPHDKPAQAGTKGTAKLCRFCGTPLLVPTALKCTACSEFQHWWQVALSRLSLDDFALLLSVATLAFVSLKSFLGVEQAKLDLRVIACTTTRIELAAFNSGSTSGILSDLQLVVVSNDAVNSDQPLTTRAANAKVGSDEVGAVLVQPNETQLLGVDVTSDIKNSLPGECKIRVVGKKFEASMVGGVSLDEPGCTCASLM
jgi:hypothetical protein